MTFSDIYSTSWESRVKKPADAVCDNNAFYWMLRKNNGVKTGDFGRFISENIRVAQNDYVQLINPDGEITMGYNNTLGDFQFTGKIIVTPVLVNEYEQAQNQGSARFLDLIEERSIVADDSTSNVMESMLQGDGTTYGGRAFSGIRSYIVDTTNTGSIGGLARATYEGIRNVSVNAPSVYTGATDASNIESRLRSVKNQLVRGPDKPNFALLGQTYYNAGADALSAKQRYTQNQEMYEANFDNYMIEGMTAVLAGGKSFSGLPLIAVDRGYLLNTKTFNLKMYSGYNFQPLKKRTSFNQLVDATVLLGIGNLTINNPGLNGVMFDS